MKILNPTLSLFHFHALSQVSTTHCSLQKCTDSIVSNRQTASALSSPPPPLRHGYSDRFLSPTRRESMIDLVYVGEGAKILGKDEKISQSRNTKGTYERKVLPPELLARNVVKLTCESAADGGTCDVYLVGTCHISPKSRRQTQALVKFLEPQVVFLELCSQRSYHLKTPKVPTLEEMRDMWKKNKNPLMILSKWFGAKFKRSYGGECILAYEEAMRYGGKVILGDRPIKVTKVGFKECLDLELQSLCPTLPGTIVHERDQYMSAKLLKVAREHNSVVAVVGLEHLPGIQKNWKQPVDMKELLHTPTDNGMFKKEEILQGVALIVILYIGWRLLKN